MPVSSDTTPWLACMLGHDRALARRTGGVTLVFSLGPARSEEERFQRVSAIAASFPSTIDSIAYCHQVHGSLVHRAGSLSQPVAEVGEGDALIATTPGRGVLVWTADCVPLLLWGPGIVAAVHSGWRGCAADVVRTTVGEMERVAGTTPADLHAALGPAVCGSCYEVGPEVPEALRQFDLDESRWLDGNHVDLRGFLAARIEALGIPAEQIETVGGCTVESPVLASHRRDGEAAGRQWSMVFLDGRPT